MKIVNFQIDSYIAKIAGEKIAGALIFGPEASVITSRFNAIAKKIVADLSDQFLVTHLNKERFNQDPSCLADEFYSFSMLGGRKLIIIKDSDVLAAAALKILVKTSDEIAKSDNFILIQAGDLDKSSALRKVCEESSYFAAIACYEDDDKTIKKLIEQQLKKNGLSQDNSVIEHLFEKFPKNRQIIASEIDKIALYFSGKDFNVAALSTIIGSQSESKVDEFIDDFVEKNYTKCFKSATYLLNNDFEAITLLRFLSNYLQKLYSAKNAIEQQELSFDEAVKAQRLFFKTEMQFRKNLKAIKLSELIYWLKEIEKLEIKIKTSSNISPKLLFLKFVQENLIAR